jgi:hypothetical protein
MMDSRYLSMKTDRRREETGLKFTRLWGLMYLLNVYLMRIINHNFHLWFLVQQLNLGDEY